LREVCDHRNTDAEVLAHAAQLIDRYLHVGNTDKRDYQLVGATCFLLAKRLVQYTDFSVTKEDILAKEIVIAVTLQWDLTCITPIDFIHPITSFFTCESGLRQLIRQSAKQIFMKILHVEGVNLFRPSYTAAACILYAVRLTVAPDADGFASGVRSQMERLLGLESAELQDAFFFITTLFKRGTVELSDEVLRVDQGPPIGSSESSKQSPP
uniref:Cyclin N-terminal domain-containing protein n=1 Tax=Mesocestoides corti TaxID=53468 RepID=A0A5K3FMP4_MESCO